MNVLMPSVTDSPPTSSGPDVNDVVEIPLLLSSRQVTALEEAAHTHGLTAAQMVRKLLRDFIALQPRSAVGV